jgi:hypothetical protein
MDESTSKPAIPPNSKYREGQAFSRAANDLAPDGFTGCGKNSVLYQGTTSVGP